MPGVAKMSVSRKLSTTFGKLIKVTEYEIFGEGSHISTNQRRESTVFSLLASDWLKCETLPRKFRTLQLCLKKSRKKLSFCLILDCEIKTPGFTSRVSIVQAAHNI